MTSRFVPEMHDIGKLVDNAKIELYLAVKLDGHYLRTKEGDLNFGAIGVVSPNSLTWTGVKHHNDPLYHDLSRSPLSGEDKVNLFLLSLADNLAASSSRAVAEERGEGMPQLSIPEGEMFKTIFKLWRDEKLPERQPEDWSPVNDLDALLEMFNLVDQAQDAREFFDKYDGPGSAGKQYLSTIPEDKSPHRAVTSLRTHLELTGKFYRILKDHVQPDAIETPTSLLYPSAEPVIQKAQAKQRWEFSFLRCMIRFPQAIVRARDLNVFSLLEQLLEDLNDPVGVFSKYVLFRTTDALWLFLPTAGTITAGEILKPLLERGFYAEVDEVKFVLEDLHPDLKTWLKEYPKTQEEFGRKHKQLAGKREALSKQLEETKRRRNAAQSAEKAYWGKQIPLIQGQVGELDRQLGEMGTVQSQRQATHERIKDTAQFQTNSLFSDSILSAAVIETDTIGQVFFVL